MSSEATNGQTPDMYGQLHPLETEELITSKLLALKDEISKLPDDTTTAWKQALEKCPQLVDTDFQLQFLRCEVFNADVSTVGTDVVVRRTVDSHTITHRTPHYHDSP
jgi:hypothetical protein